MPSYREYIGYAEKCLLYARETEATNVAWLLIPATILAWAAVEAFINNMLDDFSSLPPGLFELHERAFLLEQRLRFVDRGDEIGRFVLEGTEYRRLEDKIFFLITKFGSREDQSLKGGSLWCNFQEFKDARDRLLHPRRGKEIVLSIQEVQRFVGTAKEIIQLVSKHVWGRRVEF